MPVFAYRAADRAGQTVDGVMEASDASAVVERLQREAYFPIRVEAARGHGRPLARPRRPVAGRPRATSSPSPSSWRRSWRRACRSTARCPSSTSWRASARVKAIVADLLAERPAGSSLSEALAKHHPRPFSRLYINMVRAGEKGGVLELTLRRLAELLEARAAFAEAVVSAVAYPIVVLSRRVGAMIFLLTFVLPRFAMILADLGQALPLPTRLVLGVSAACSGVLVGVGVLLCSGRSGPLAAVAQASGRGSAGTRWCSGCR